MIALTAHAMKGEQDRFVERGFDDYMSKPVDLPTLRDRLQRLSRQTAAKPPAKRRADRGGAVINKARLEEFLELFDAPDVRDILERFLTDSRASVTNLQAGFAQKNYNEVLRLAHDLIGAASNHGASRLSDLAKSIEVGAGSDEGSEEFALSVAALSREHDAAVAGIRNWLAEIDGKAQSGGS